MPDAQPSTDVLLLPRTTAIALMHAAQLSPDHPIAGVLALRDDQPADLIHCPTDSKEALDAACSRAASNGGIFAIYYSRPTAAAEPEDLPSPLQDAATRHPLLIVSLNTKGVLQTRAWTHTDTGFVERELTAIEPPTAA